MKEPRQASTWSGTRRLRAKRDNAEMSSIVPNGKFGAEPTIWTRISGRWEKCHDSEDDYHDGIPID